MISRFSLNPIVALEWRARWRGARSFRLLFVCVALLGVVAFFSYLSAVESFNYGLDRASTESAAHAGAGLFIGLSLAQTLGWILLAPLMTATTIAAEREQGILEGVQLSRLKPLQIVLGKLASALLFALLLGATTLPILSICFILGGVSPGEFVQSWVLQFSTALCGASLGLFFSAHSRRAGAALRGALISVIAWLIGSYIIFTIGSIAFWAGGATQLTALQRILAQLAVLQGYLNPTLVMGNSLLSGRSAAGGFVPNTTSQNASAFSQLLSDIMAQPPWMVCLAMQFGATLFFLFFAARAIRRPLGEFDEAAARRKKERREKKGDASTRETLKSADANATVANAIGTNTTVANAIGTNARDADFADAAVAFASAAPASARGEAKSGAAWWDVPYFSRLTFSNPMLQREVRGKFRMRRVSAVVLAIEGLLALGVAYLYLRSLGWALTDAEARTTIWWVLAWVGMILILIATPIMGAASFTRERETGTFEGVMLSLLSDREIERGKLLAPLFACAVYGVLPLLPLLLLCIRPQTYTGYNTRSWLHGITIGQALATFCIIGAVAFAGTSIGMAASWTARRTAEAVGRSLGIMFVWLALLPGLLFSILGALVNSGSVDVESGSSFESLAETLGQMLALFGNPLVALGFLTSNETVLFGSASPFVVALLSVCGSICISLLARSYLANAMTKRALEQERKR